MKKSIKNLTKIFLSGVIFTLILPTPSSAFISDISSTSFVSGDVDYSGSLTYKDAQMILKAVVGQIEFNQYQKMVGDVSGDGRITAYDAALVMKRIKGNGDVNADGEINEEDYNMIMNAVVGNISLDNYQISVGDMSGDEIITAYDAALLIKWNDTIKVDDITDNSATVSWSTNRPGDSTVVYATNYDFTNLEKIYTHDFTTHHRIILENILKPQTKYYFRVKSKDQYGNQVISQIKGFTTLKDVTPPIIYNINVSNITKHSAVISWRTNEPSDTRVDYATTTSYGLFERGDSNVTYHKVELYGLLPGTVYHYQVSSKDKAGNKTVSNDYVFVTLGTFPNFFYLKFDNSLISEDGIRPLKVNNPSGLYFDSDAIEGKALRVGSWDSYVEYSCNKVFNPYQGGIEVWINFDQFDSDQVIWQTDDSRYVLYYDKGMRNGYKRIVARAGGKEASFYFDKRDWFIDEPNQWKTNEWHHVAMTWLGTPYGEVTLYIDGESKDTAIYYHGKNCEIFRIGNNYWPGLNWSNGQIDELKIFSQYLTAKEVKQDYLSYLKSLSLTIGGSNIDSRAIQYYSNSIFHSPSLSTSQLAVGKLKK